MSRFFSFLFLFISLTTSRQLLCDQNDCTFTNIESGDTIIAIKNATHVTINCLSYQQCKTKNNKPLTIFSTVPITLNCNEKESCYGIKVFIGIPPNTQYFKNELKSFNINDFIPLKEGGESIINCIGLVSCKNSAIQVSNNLIDKVTINALATDSLKDSFFFCDLNDIQKCIIKCSNLISKSCDNIIFQCNNNDDCNCFGKTCPKVIKVCENDPCTIKPIGGEIVVCTNEYNICNIDCGYKKDACKYINSKPVIIYSGSSYTNIFCNNENSCVGIEANIGIPDILPIGFNINDFKGIKKMVDINCNGKSSCKMANLSVKGNIEYVYLNGMNYDSVKQANIDIDLINKQTFNIDCGDLSGLNSCEKTNINCGLNTNCVCNGGCPEININNIETTTTSTPSVSPTIEPTIIQLNTNIIRKGIINAGTNENINSNTNTRTDFINKLTETYSLIGAALCFGLCVFMFWCFKQIRKFRKESKLSLIKEEEDTYNTFNDNYNHFGNDIELVM